MTIQKPFFTVPLPIGVITAGNQVSGKFASHLGQFKNYGMTWRTSDAVDVWVRGDLGAAKAISFVSLMRANAQAGTTIRVRLGNSLAEVDSPTATYDSGLVPFISPAITREDGLYHSHLELPSIVNCQWYRIDISGHTGDFEASALVLGKRVQSDTFYSKGHGFGVEDLGGIEWSSWGVPSEEDGVVFRRLNFVLEWVSADKFETDFRPMLEKLGKRGMVHCCFDPDPTTSRQAKTYFGVLEDNPFATVGNLKFDRVAIPYSILSPY